MKSLSHGLLALLALLMLAAPPASADFAAGIKAYDAEDDVAALRELLPLADAGNIEAQFKVGRIYYRNKAVPRDIEKSILYYKRAASAGFVLAQYNLGNVLIKEKGPNKSVADGIKWLDRAAASGYLPAMFNLGVYHDFGEFMPIDYRTALLWYRRAAEKNYATAQLNLGLLYISGRGTKRDYVEGFKWLFIAKENGEPGKPDAIQYFSNIIGKEFVDIGKSEMIKWKKARAIKQ